MRGKQKEIKRRAALRSGKTYLKKAASNSSLPENDAQLGQIENDLFAEKPLGKKETKKLLNGRK